MLSTFAHYLFINEPFERVKQIRTKFAHPQQYNYFPDLEMIIPTFEDSYPDNLRQRRQRQWGCPYNIKNCSTVTYVNQRYDRTQVREFYFETNYGCPNYAINYLFFQEQISGTLSSFNLTQLGTKLVVTTWEKGEQIYQQRYPDYAIATFNWIFKIRPDLSKDYVLAQNSYVKIEKGLLSYLPLPLRLLFKKLKINNEFF